MKDSEKSKQQLIEELNFLRNQLASQSDSNTNLGYSRSLHEALLSSKKFGIIIIQEDSVVYASNIFEEVLGIPAENFVGRNAYELLNLLTPEFKDDITREYRENSSQMGHTYNGDFQVFSKDGKKIWIEIDAKVIMYHGKIALLSLLRDITKRKKTEIALQESRQRANLCLTSAGLATWDQNFVTGEVIRSKSWSEMLGYTEDEIGEFLDDWKKLIHPDDIPKVLEVARRHESGEIPEFDVEHRMKTKDGQWKWIKNWGKIVERDDKGNPIRALGTHLDITAQKQVEEIREKSRRFLGDILNATEIDIIIRDKDSNILYSGQEYAKYYDYSVDELIGLNNKDIWKRNGRSEEETIRWLDEDHQVHTTGKTLDYEELIEYDNGKLKIWYRTIKKKIVTPDGVSGVLVTYEDITNRKLAEQTLKESQEKFREIAELAPIGIYETDQNFRFTYANKHALEIYGYDSSDLNSNLTCMDMFPESEREKLDINIKKIIAGTHPEEVHEYVACRKDGSTFHVEFKSLAIFNNDELMGLRGVISDITKRKQMLRALRQSEERFKELFHNAPLAYQSLDSNTNILEVNQAWLDTMEYSREEVIGSSFKRYLMPDTQEILESTFEQFLRDGAIHSKIFRLRSKTGKAIIVDYHGKIQFTKDGEFLRTHCIFQDITDKIKAEEARKKAERDKEIVLNSMSENLSYYDTNLQIQWTNKATGDLIGKSSDDLTGRYCYEIWHNRSGPCDACPALKALDTGQIQEAEKQMADGKLFYLRVYPVRDETGEIAGLLELGLDITKRKEAEKALYESEEKYRLLFETAHDSIILLKNGLIIDCNQKTLNLFDSSKDKMIGRSPTEFSPEKQPNSSDSLVAGKEKMNLALDGKPQFFEWVHQKSNGELFEAEISLNKISFQNVDFVLAIVRDITERKLAEEALRENERRFRLMAESIDDIFWMSSPRLDKHIYVSPVIEKIWQRPLLNFINDPKYFLEAIHPEDRKNYISTLESHHYKGKPYEAEYRIIQDDGSVKWILDRAFPVNNEHGKIEFMAGVSTDITERKHAEKAMKTSYEILSMANKHLRMDKLLDEVVGSLQDLTDCEAIGVRLLGENGLIPYHSYIGFSDELYELENSLSILKDKCMCINVIRSDTDFTKPYYTAEGSFFMNASSKFLHSLSDKEKSEIQSEYRNVCNKFGYETVALVPIKIDSRTIGLIHFADSRENMIPFEMVKILEQLSIQLGAIIERVKAGEALRYSEERFRNLVESMNDGLLVVDQELRFTYINEKMADYLGVVPGDVIGLQVEDYLDAKNRKMIRSQWELRKQGGSNSYELTWTRKDKVKVVTIISPKPLWSTDNVFKGSFSVVTDITYRKHNELIDKSKSHLADKLRSYSEIDDCLKAGCQALAEAELLKNSAFVILDLNNELMHVEYSKKGSKELILRKNEIPEVINVLNNEPDRFSKLSNSLVYNSSESDGERLIVTPIVNQIVNHQGWMISSSPYEGKKIDLNTTQFVESVAESVSKRINELLFLTHLEFERHQLEEKNIALREVLASIEEEKMEIRQRVAQRIDQMVIPTLNRIVNSDGTVNQTYYDLLSTTVRELVASSGGLMHLYSKLSPREVEICNLIKGGSSSKEIAKTLHLSVATIQKHRERIRHKLGLANKNINLASYLKNPS